GKKVYTEDNVLVGRLEDLIFVATENPFITKLVVRSTYKEKLIIPSEYLERMNENITIVKEYIVVDLEENELFVEKNLLDKQIIDLKGNKIVRVNDIALQDKGPLYVSGVDIGILGIVRWFGFELTIMRLLNFMHISLASQFLSWGDIQPLELVHGKVKLRKLEDKLKSIRPEDLADYLEKTNVNNARKFLKILDDEKAAAVMSNLNINYQTLMFKHFKPDKAAKFISLIDSDEAVDVLLTLTSKKRELILNELSLQKKQEIISLLNLSNNPIGEMITTQFLTVKSDFTVRMVINKIRNETGHFAFLDYVYVVNSENQLVGVINLHELILQNYETAIYKIMVQNVIVAHLTSPKEIVIKKMLKYKLDALPIINENKHIVGVVRFDDVAELLLDKI
ncbi:MAG: CBS domain-containing protein, partial [bacterium]|nr:CBS domain-containing protein [bacterium]